MKHSYLKIEFKRKDPLNLFGDLLMPRPERMILTFPELSVRSARQWHELLRTVLFCFEDQYERELARAYGWAPYEDDEEEEEEDDEEDELF